MSDSQLRLIIAHIKCFYVKYDYRIILGSYCSSSTHAKYILYISLVDEIQSYRLFFQGRVPVGNASTSFWTNDIVSSIRCRSKQTRPFVLWLESKHWFWRNKVRIFDILLKRRYAYVVKSCVEFRLDNNFSTGHFGTIIHMPRRSGRIYVGWVKLERGKFIV